MNRTVYIGPPRPYGLPLMNRAVLMPGAHIAGLDKAREEHPSLNRLFVPIERLAVARAALAEQGSALQRAYAAVQQETIDQRKEGK